MCSPSARFITHSIADSSSGLLGAAAKGSVQAALAELRFALGVAADERGVLLEHREDREHTPSVSANAAGSIDARSSAEVWWLGSAVRRAREAPTGRLKPGEQNWRSSLPYGREVDDLIAQPAATKHMRGCSIDFGVARAGSSCSVRSRITDARQHEAGANPVGRSSLRESQTIAPIVPGTKRKRYV